MSSYPFSNSIVGVTAGPVEYFTQVSQDEQIENLTQSLEYYSRILSFLRVSLLSHYLCFQICFCDCVNIILYWPVVDVFIKCLYYHAIDFLYLVISNSTASSALCKEHTLSSPCYHSYDIGLIHNIEKEIKRNFLFQKLQARLNSESIK